MKILSTPRRRWIAAGTALAVLLGLGAAVYFLWLRPKPPPLPGPDSPAYREYAEAFQIGTAALDVGPPDVALSNLTKAIEIIPGEPAGWANRGLFYLRNNQLDESARDLRRAHELAPDNLDIMVLLGLLADLRGASDEAVSYLSKSVAQRPNDVTAMYKLA